MEETITIGGKEVSWESFNPKGKRVLLRIEHGPIKSAGGLYIPDAEKRKLPIGEVYKKSDDCSEGVIEREKYFFDVEAGVRLSEYWLLLGEEHLLGRVEL
jgi:co-chaperonin GroES (HSP10)